MDRAAIDLTDLVDRLRRDRRRDPYRGRREYSQAARDLTARCAALIDAGAAATVVPFLRKAVERMTAALMYMDDSSGIVGDDLQQVMDLYARACVAGPPDPKRLAGWLVKLECDGPGWPRILVRDFAPALGASGLTEVERLVAERAESTDPESRTGQFAIRDLREQLAEVSGDVDRYVNVLAEHLESAIQYGRIVDALRASGRTAEAIAWARRGLAEKTGWPHTDDLRDALVALSLEQGDAEAALAVRRAEFERHPTLAAYGAWASTAAHLRAGDVTAAAVERLRQRVAEQPAYTSELVDVLTATGAHDEAWAIGQANPDRLGRQQVRPFLMSVTVAPITSTIRGLSTEVPVGKANGLDRDSVISCDNVTTVPRAAIGRRIGHLLPGQEASLTYAIAAAYDLDR